MDTLNVMGRNFIKNQSYIAIPFTYTGEKSFETFMSEHKTFFMQKGCTFSGPQEVKKRPRLNYVSEMFDQVQLYVDEEKYVSENGLVSWAKSEVYYFPTNVGFLVINLEFETDVDNRVELRDIIGILQDLVEYIELEDDNFTSGLERKFFATIHERVNVILDLFDKDHISEKSCLLFHSLINALDDKSSFHLRHINKLGTLSMENMLKTYDEVEMKFKVDSINEYHMAVKCMALAPDYDLYEAIRSKVDVSGTVTSIQQFKENYQTNSFLLFLMLHHERQVLLNCKRSTVGLADSDGKQVAKIKSKILDCLSCYSFETISDDSITQLIYEKYKGILKLSLMEENMTNLVFKLDDEMGKKKEERITKLTIIFSLLGGISVLGSAFDIVQHIFNFINWLPGGE